jgi:hypothetical protein
MTIEELILKYEKEKADAISEIKKCQDERDTEAEEYYIGQKSAFTSILNDIKQLSIASSDRSCVKGNITCESPGECERKVCICTSGIYCSMRGDIIGEQGD